MSDIKGRFIHYVLAGNGEPRGAIHCENVIQPNIKSEEAEKRQLFMLMIGAYQIAI